MINLGTMKKVKNINDLYLLFHEKKIFSEYNIKRIGVFGSFARGEHFNDIDLFIEDELNFQQLIQLKSLLERETGIPFDIMQKKYAEPVILYRALKEMQYAAALVNDHTYK